MNSSTDVPAKRFIKSITSGEIKDVTSDVAEAMLDAKLEDGVFKELPVVGWIFKSVSAFNKVQDYFFLKKLYKFLYAFGQTTADERNSLRQKLEESGKEQEVGEKVLFLLGQADEVDKGALIGKLFVAYTKGLIELDSLHRAMIATNKVYLADLAHLHMCCKEDKMIRDALTTETRAGFLNAGLIAIDGTDQARMDGSGKIKYVCTDTARIIVEYGL